MAGSSSEHSPDPRRCELIPEIVPFADRGFLARFASEDSAAAWADRLRSLQIEGVEEIVAAYRDVAVFADPDRIEPVALEDLLRRINPGAGSAVAGRSLLIPVLYDGLDLHETAALLGISTGDLVALHSRPVYRVFAIGFQPGFPYCGWLEPPLAGLPRRTPPRVSVPAGSVAIAGRQTGIYPARSPGGWRILGRTPLCLADLATDYFAIAVGDRIQFNPISPAEFEARRHERL